MSRFPRAPRGVSLIEGLIATLVLLLGLVGVLQGLVVASVQNSVANRHSRAVVIAQQMLTAIEQQGRTRLLAVTPMGLFSAPCQSFSSLSMGAGSTALFQGAPAWPDISAVPSSLPGYTACYVDFDSPSILAVFGNITPGYSAQDNTTYERAIAVYRNLGDPTQLIYVGVNVGWRELGRVRTVKRFTALYDTAVNQTNLEF